MSAIFTTEITSDQIISDNPLHQRLLKPYLLSRDWVKGDLLEVGCGEGRGIMHLLPNISSYTAIDKIESAVNNLKKKFPAAHLVSGNLPPLPFKDSSFDSVVSFQVIEHIADDLFFLKEILRVLKEGGVALITTPNRKLSLSRNPWHVREYLPDELKGLAGAIFPSVDMKGITGNEKIMTYHEQNRKSVAKLMRWDVLNLQYLLPASLLKIPYELLNRLNRNRLQRQSDSLVRGVTPDDYQLVDDASNALDLFLIARK